MRLSPDILLGLITIGMTVLGGIVSALPPTDLVQKSVYVVLFICLGGSAWVLIVKQARQTSKSETELRNEVKRLAAESAEVTRLEASNNELQQQLLDLTKMNASLVKESISTSTGGDSFCWMAVNFQFGHPCPLITHSGRYTLYGVNVRITNLNKMRRKIERHEAISFSDDIMIPVGELQVGRTWCYERLAIPFSEDSAQHFNVFFGARNGMWTERLRLRKIDDHWSSAIQVFFSYSSDGSSPRKEPVFEQVAQDYPRNEKGLVDWEQA